MKERAFTLNELLITVAILLIISGAIYSGYSLSQKAYRESELAAEITQNGRVILERMTREIRQAKEIVGDFPEEKEGALSEITFEDGHTTSSYHYIHYFKTNNNIKREIIGYYFFDDPDETLVPWDTTSTTQVVETKSLEEPEIIGEWVENLELWGTKTINITLGLVKLDKSLDLETKVFCRNF